jgi:hypothetical protein
MNTGEDIALAFCQAEGETLLDGLAERLAAGQVEVVTDSDGTRPRLILRR